MSNTYASNPRKWEMIYYNFLVKCLEIEGIDKFSDHCYMVIGRWKRKYDVFVEADFKVIE